MESSEPNFPFPPDAELQRQVRQAQESITVPLAEVDNLSPGQWIAISVDDKWVVIADTLDALLASPDYKLDYAIFRIPSLGPNFFGTKTVA